LEKTMSDFSKTVDDLSGKLNGISLLYWNIRKRLKSMRYIFYLI
jgi:hypothetical protein